MDSDDLDLQFYPVVALADDERAEWHRIVLSAVGDTAGILTIVFVQEPAGWLLEGFLWASSAGGFSPLTRGRFLPLRSRVVSALNSAGKRVRTP